MLNFNHLYYFWLVAKSGSLSRAAQAIHLSQPAMSLQIKTLEENLGITLFERRKRRLILTQEGQAIFAKCDDMFHVSSQIQSMIENKEFVGNRKVLNIGASSTLSKNFQFFMLNSLFQKYQFRATIRSGEIHTLFQQIEKFELDVIIANDPPPNTPPEYVITKVAEYPVCIVGLVDHVHKSPLLKDILEENDVFLPTRISRVRLDFDTYTNQKNIQPRIIGEIDDTALLRLFATSGLGVAVISRMGIMRDLAQGDFQILYEIPSLTETFYIVCKKRIFEEYELGPFLDDFQANITA